MELRKNTILKIFVTLLFIGQTIYLQGQATNSSYFITTWNTEAGDPGGTSFKLPLSGGAYDVDRNNDGDFDDANETNQTGTITIDFGVGNAGRKTIAVRPNPTNNTNNQLRINHAFGGDHTPKKLTSIDKWGDIVWTSMANAFEDCSNMTLADEAGIPDLTMVNDMSNMFDRATNFNGDLSTWDVSNVTNMRYVFSGTSNFNSDLNSWNTSKATNMRWMFTNAIKFNNDLSNWDVSQVTNIEGMFFNADSFNSSINAWNVSNVTDMSHVFFGTAKFNSDISNWNVSSTADMSYMFYQAVSFTGNLNSWDVSKVSNMEFMFDEAISFNSNLSSWNVSNVTNMRFMLSEAKIFNRNLSSWNVSNVTSMSAMLENATNFNGDLSSWNVSSIKYMTRMFNGATSFTSENYDALLTGWSSLSILQRDVDFQAPPTTYCAGKPGRDILTGTYNWNISGDSGEDCSGISVDEEFLSNTKIYPNPTNSKINIESSFSIDKLELYNVLGAKIFSVSKTNVLDLTSLRQGIYILKVFSGDKVFAKKVIKD